MSDFPPLPRYLTLEEAAQTMTERTGKAWTPRHILGCAERHELSVFARIGHAVKFGTVHPAPERPPEYTADAGSVPLLDTEAIKALLLTGAARSTGWEGFESIDFLGQPAKAWVKVVEIAPGYEAPIVRTDDCRVTADGVRKLAEAFIEPEPGQSATAFTAHAAAIVSTPEAHLLFTGQVAHVFRDIHFHDWMSNLESPSEWLRTHRKVPGKRGNKPVQARWDALGIAKALSTMKPAEYVAQLRARFRSETLLRQLRPDWDEFYSSMYD